MVNTALAMGCIVLLVGIVIIWSDKKSNKPRKPGYLKGKITISDDFDAPYEITSEKERPD